MLAMNAGVSFAMDRSRSESASGSAKAVSAAWRAMADDAIKVVVLGDDEEGILLILLKS